MRACAGLKAEDVGAPIDVLWFRIPRDSNARSEPLFNAGPGHIVVCIDRGAYYQCAFVIAKGGTEAVKARGIEAFRKAVGTTVPRLSGKVGALEGFDDVSLLTVAIDRLRNWSRSGLLMIGDGAHAMSPIGGVGINLAIQDAVAAANLLAGPLYDGTLKDQDLERVRRRRLWPVRATQFIQVQAQSRILAPILAGRNKAPKPPLLFRIVSRTPWLKRRLAVIIGLGIRPEHVHSPARTTLAS